MSSVSIRCTEVRSTVSPPDALRTSMILQKSFNAQSPAGDCGAHLRYITELTLSKASWPQLRLTFSHKNYEYSRSIFHSHRVFKTFVFVDLMSLLTHILQVPFFPSTCTAVQHSLLVPSFWFFPSHIFFSFSLSPLIFVHICGSRALIVLFHLICFCASITCAFTSFRSSLTLSSHLSFDLLLVLSLSKFCIVLESYRKKVIVSSYENRLELLKMVCRSKMFAHYSLGFSESILFFILLVKHP